MVRIALMRLAAIGFAAVVLIAISAIVERSDDVLEPVEQLAISFD